MPTIEISQQQAEALARGEHVTLAPPSPPRPRRSYILVSPLGNVFTIKTDKEVTTGHGLTCFQAFKPSEGDKIVRVAAADVTPLNKLGEPRDVPLIFGGRSGGGSLRSAYTLMCTAQTILEASA
jgi:hypothetical protein